jgi:2-dehydropantoate 2-reductase
LGNFTTPAKTVTADALRQPFDLVLLSCKAYDLADSIAAIGPAVGSNTGVVPLLNGVAHIARLGEAFGASQVLGGVAHIAATLRPDGVVHHLSTLAGIRFGRIAEAPDPWSQPLHQAFTRAQVQAVLSATIAQDLWDKLVFLATLAGMTCLMRASVGTILATDDGERLIQQLFAECRAIAAAEGFPPNPAAMENFEKTLMQRGSPLTASMARDVERGGPTEADHILGDLARRAAARGLAAPLLRVAVTHLQAHEIGRNKG